MGGVRVGRRFPRRLGWDGDFGAHVVCGSPWTLVLRCGDRCVSCSGNGIEWEEWDGRIAAPPGFKSFFVALVALIGTQVFTKPWLLDGPSGITPPRRSLGDNS